MLLLLAVSATNFCFSLRPFSLHFQIFQPTNMAVKITVSDKNTSDNLIFPLVQDEKLAELLADLANQNGLDAAALQNDFKAEPKEILLTYLPGQPSSRVFLLGIGKKSGFSEMLAGVRSACFRQKSKLPTKISLDLRHFENEKIAVLADAAAAGMLLGLYQTKPNGNGKDEKHAPNFADGDSFLEIIVPTAALEIAEKAVRRAEVFAEVQKQILDLVNKPSNKKTPALLAEFAKNAAEDCGFSIRVMFREEIIDEGLTALLAVNQGSPNTPAFLVLEYLPENLGEIKTPIVGLVGKGVTFDTGGISIKPSSNMHLMKSDMGGAAAVLGAFMAVAKLKLPVKMVGAIPSTENMVDGESAKPGDVFQTYSGKTIEIIDTDAEGRIILADGLAWLVKNKNPDVLIDLATLTGSIVRSLGPTAAGLFSQNDSLAAALDRAGQVTGERLWRMPLWEEYGTDLKSDVADLRNYTGKLHSEASSAAKFLEHFTAEHPAWAHLDIAGVAFGDSEFASQKSATAFGVRLLTEFVERLERIRQVSV